jgi:hypothetical protein
LIGYPISRSLTTYCVRLELRSRPSTGVTRLQRYLNLSDSPRRPACPSRASGWSSAGFWSLTVFLILSVSGVDLAFPVTFQNMVGAVLPLDSGVADGTLDEATIASIANRNALTVDDAAKLALAAVPNARLLSIQLPPSGGGVYLVAMNPEPYGIGYSPQVDQSVGLCRCII